ncbi:MAG: hypothetical protein JJE12_07110 [Anaerolineales bacterium]|nr:hypothetical protein [Anaerolineales bacterium]
MKDKNNALRIIRTIDLKNIDDALKNKNFLSVIFTVPIQTLSSPILTVINMPVDRRI